MIDKNEVVKNFWHEINKEEVFLFLDTLRDSGITNMFGAGPFIEEAYCVGRREANELLLEWMKSFRMRHAVTD